MNEEEKELFIKLTHFLGHVLGRRYEVVLHTISPEGSYIAAIVNNHISGRTIHSPLTEFASNLIQEKTYLKEDYLCNYKASTNNNKTLQGSTFFIKKKQKLVGILCINHDNTEMKNAISKILEIEQISDFGTIVESSNISIKESNVENLSLNIEDILAQYVDLNYLKSGFMLTSTQKNDIIEKLYNKGIFNIKGVIPIVAKLLKTSEPSIYRYLKKIK